MGSSNSVTEDIEKRSIFASQRDLPLQNFETKIISITRCPDRLDKQLTDLTAKKFTVIELELEDRFPFHNKKKGFETHIRDLSNPVIILQAYGEVAEYNGIWTVSNASSEDVRDAVGNIVQFAECKITCYAETSTIGANINYDCVLNEEQLLIKAADPDKNSKFTESDSKVILAPTLRFQFRSVFSSISKVDNVEQTVLADVQCEFKLSCVSEIKDDDFIRTTLNKYGIVGPDNSIGSFSNCIREDYRIIEDCIKASTEKGRENLFDYIWKIRVRGTFIDGMELHLFPFDRQSITFSMRLNRPSNIAIFYFDETRTEEDIISKDNMFLKSGFQLMEVYTPYKLVDFCSGRTEKSESHSRLQYDWVQMRLTLDRIPNYYIVNVYAPMCIFTFLAVVALSRNFDGSRLGTAGGITISMTVLLIAVAYKFVVAAGLPQISYLTEVDKYVNMCFMFIVGMVIENACYAALQAQYHFDDDGLEKKEDWFIVIYLVGFVAINILFVFRAYYILSERDDLDAEITVVTVMDLKGMSQKAFHGDPSFETAFKSAVAAATKMSDDNVAISEVVDIARDRIKITFDVNVMKLGVYKDESAAYDALSNLLENSVSDGTFSKSFEKVSKALGVTDLNKVTVTLVKPENK